MAVKNKYYDDRKIWWIPTERYNYQVGLKNGRAKDFIAMAFDPNYCRDCGLVWEIIYEPGNGGGSNLQKYHDFPTYKLDREICPSCKVNK
tara:strand:+ start:721 stop:990 length:270 start_codon:yes stop_codon:yes gene_type:complete